MKSDIVISIIIPTFDRYDCLQETCSALLRQDFSDIEILVIDQTPSVKAKKI